MEEDKEKRATRIKVIGGSGAFSKVLISTFTTTLGRELEFHQYNTDIKEGLPAEAENDLSRELVGGDVEDTKVFAIKASPMIPFSNRSHVAPEVCIPDDDWPHWKEPEARAQHSRLGIKETRRGHIGFKQKSTVFRGKGKK